MKNSQIHDELILPILPKKRVNKPMKDILIDLKIRKVLIQQRLKTQQQINYQKKNQSELTNNSLKIITQVPNVMFPYGFYKCNGQSRSRQNIQSPIPKIYQTLQQKTQRLERSSQKYISNRKKQKLLMYSIEKSQKHREQKIHKRQNLRERIEQLLKNISTEPKERTEAMMEKLKIFLSHHNAFFSKIQSILSLCLLKLNRFVYVYKNQYLYRIGDERNAFYIILYGRIKLYNSELSRKRLCKICHPGETIGQELIFIPGTRKIVYESAKALTKCLLIEIKMSNYKKMNEEMIIFGFRVAFNEMESILRRSFITKNWLRYEKKEN